MSRRRFLAACALVGAWPAGAPHALAQRKAKIGVLGPVAVERSVWARPLLRHLAALGYREGLEYRASQGVDAKYAELAHELLRAKCDLIIPLGSETPARTLRDARTSIPVVFLAVDYDPVQKGIIKTLSRPEGNMTGVYVPQGALVSKRFEILREVVPKARRFLLLSDLFSSDQTVSARTAAAAAGIQLTEVQFSKPPYDLASAFEAGRRAKVEGLIGLASPGFAAAREELAALLLQHRLPAVASATVHAVAGTLISLSPDVEKTTGRVAALAARILNGTKPFEIPVEQADEFELTINAKTAKALGVRIPESVLARATRIVS